MKMEETKVDYLKERDGDLFSNADLKQLIVPLLIEQLLAIAVGMADSVWYPVSAGGGVECVAD